MLCRCLRYTGGSAAFGTTEAGARMTKPERKDSSQIAAEGWIPVVPLWHSAAGHDLNLG